MNNLPNFDRNLTCCTVLEMAHYADWNYNIIFYFLKLSQLSQNWNSNNLPNFYWNLTCSTVLKLVHHADYNSYQIFYFLNFSLLSQLSQKVFLNYFNLNLRAQARQCFIVFVCAPVFITIFIFVSVFYHSLGICCKQFLLNCGNTVSWNPYYTHTHRPP